MKRSQLFYPCCRWLMERQPWQEIPPGLANALEAKEPCHQSRARTPEAPCLTDLALLAQQPAR
jgi:hypothetical protein